MPILYLGPILLVSRLALRLGVLFFASVPRCIGGTLAARPELINQTPAPDGGGREPPRSPRKLRSTQPRNASRSALHARGTAVDAFAMAK